MFNLNKELPESIRGMLALACVAFALVLSACSSMPLLPTDPAPSAPAATQTMPPVTRAPQVVVPAAPPVVAQAPAVMPPAAVPPATVLPQTGTTPGTPGGYYQGDGPDANPPPNLEATPDAMPQVEPLNKFANEPYVALGQTFVPDKAGKPYAAAGIASWYGKQFHGRKTASGETYNMYAMSAAHPTLPIPSYARVTNRANNKSVVVRVNDRGPFHANRVIDLSYTAALKLGYIQQGSADVIVESISSQEVAALNSNANRPATVITSSSPQPAPMAVPITVPVQSNVSSKPGYLQLGVFANSANAANFVQKIKQDTAWLTEPVEISIIDKLYRVRVGPYSDSSLAKSISARIKSSLGISPIWSPL